MGGRATQSMHLAEARSLTYVDSDSDGILRGLDGQYVSEPGSRQVRDVTECTVTDLLPCSV